MPAIQRLAIWSREPKWSDLAFCKAELRWIFDVVPEESIDFVGVEGAVILSVDIFEAEESSMYLQSLDVGSQQQADYYRVDADCYSHTFAYSA